MEALTPDLHPESWDVDTSWKILGERRKSRAGSSIPPGAITAHRGGGETWPHSSFSVSPPVLSPDQAWYVLGSRKIQRLRRSLCKQLAQADASTSLSSPDALDASSLSSASSSPTEVPTEVAQKYLADIEKMNCLITISSVAEKAAASWKSRSDAKILFSHHSQGARSPSDDLFDMPLNTPIRKLEADDRPNKVQFHLSPDSSRDSVVSSHQHADVSDLSDGPSMDSSFLQCVLDDSSEPSKQPQSSPSQSSGERGKKSQRARKRGDSLVGTSSCHRHSSRRRRFSKHDSVTPNTTANSDCCSKLSRRRSSLVFCPRVPDVLSAGARILSENPAPSMDFVRLANARRTSTSSPSRRPASPLRSAASPLPQSSSSLSTPLPASPPRRLSDTAARRRCSTVSTTCAVSMFAHDLRLIAAEIPAGDPRIGELYSAAARAFGPPKFISSQQRAEAQHKGEGRDEDHPNEQTE